MTAARAGLPAKHIDDLLGDVDGDIDLRFFGARPEMRRRDDVRDAQQRVVGRGGFGGEHIDSRPGDPARLRGFRHGGLIENTAPRDIDQANGRLHQTDLLGIDHARRLFGLRDMNRDIIGLFIERVQIDQFDPQRLGLFGLEVGVIAEHDHLERLQPFGDFPADLAEADDPECFAVDFRPHVLLAVPLAAAQGTVGLRDMAGEGQQHRDSQFGSRKRVAFGAVDDEDAPIGRRLDIDIVHADSGPPDDLQVGGSGNDVCRHFRFGAHGQGVILTDDRCQFFFRQTDFHIDLCHLLQ